MKSITPFLWFDTNADEAMRFYCDIFPESRVISTMPGPDGRMLGGSFELQGREFRVLNGGPVFKFTEAISMMVDCETQEEVDTLWEKLGEGGSYQDCGWLKDKFGLSWQIVPVVLGEYLSDPDPEKSGRVMQAMLKMQKLHIGELQAAYDNQT